MGSNRKKRGLMAPQPARQIAALDFAHASEAFDRALALYRATNQDDDQETFAAAIRVVDATAEALCAIPAKDRASIAKKVAAAAWLSEDDAFDFADPAVVRRLAKAGPEERHTKALLAIYLDLTAPEVEPNAGLIGTATMLNAVLDRYEATKQEALYEKWDEETEVLLPKIDQLPATRENVPAKLAGLGVLYHPQGGLDAMPSEALDARLLRDIVKGLQS